MRPARKRPGVGGENRETRLARSRAGLLQSTRDFHLVFVTFGALQSLRNSDALFALLGTALETHVACRSQSPAPPTTRIALDKAQMPCRCYSLVLPLRGVTTAKIIDGMQAFDFGPTSTTHIFSIVLSEKGKHPKNKRKKTKPKLLSQRSLTN